MKDKNKPLALFLAGSIFIGYGGIHTLNATTLSPSQISKSDDNVYPKIGTQKNLVVLANISGQKFNHDEKFYNSIYYGDNENSVNQFLNNQSNGKFSISPLKTNATTYQGVVQVDINADDYSDIAYDSYDTQEKLAYDILQKVSDKINLADADKNGDNKFNDTWRLDNLDSNEELNIVIILSGSTSKISGQGDKIQAWPHTIDMNTNLNGYILQNSLTISSEYIDDNEVGSSTLAHEFLHNLNVRDLYADSISIGPWSIMNLSYGNRDSEEQGNDPNPLDLLHKIRLGWVTPTEINLDSKKTYTYDKTKAYYAFNPKDKNEIYLFDYRDYNDTYEQSNYRYGLRDSGLIIWKLNVSSLEEDWDDDDWALNTNGARTSYYVLPFSESLGATVDNTLTKVGDNRNLEELNINISVSDKAFTISNSKEDSLPVIIAIDREINKGSKFEPLETVTATSPSGEDITDKVKVKENNVNVDKVGDYTVTYSLTYNGNEVTKTIKVSVKDSDNLPTITAENIIIKIGDKFNPLDNVTAKDCKGKDITSDIKIVKNTVDTNKEGSYLVIYSVEDSDGNSINKSIIVYVTDNTLLKSDITPPVITGVSDRLLKIGDKYDPLEGLNCVDNVDGNIKLKIESNNVDTSKQGIYYVTYSGEDSSQNKSLRTIRVTVMNSIEIKDKEAPTITPLADEIELPLGISYNPLDFIAVNDNVDGNIISDVTYSISGDENKEGSHTIYYDVKDSSGNKSTANLKLNLVNNGIYFAIPDTVIHIGDKFNDLDNIKAYDNTGKDITSQLTVTGSTLDTNNEGIYKIKYELGSQSYIRTVKVVDKSVEILTPKIGQSNLAENKGVEYKLPKVSNGTLEDTTVYTDKVGIQNVLFTATDSNGNQTKEFRKIIITDNLDDEQPSIYLKSNVVSSGYSLKDMIIALDKKDGDITSKVIISENNIDINNPGLYNVTFSVIDSDGNAVNHTYDIIVKDKDEEEPITDKPEPKGENSNIVKDNTYEKLGSNGVNEDTFEDLPKTGVNSAFTSIITGIGLILMGLVLELKRKLQ